MIDGPIIRFTCFRIDLFQVDEVWIANLTYSQETKVGNILSELDDYQERIWEYLCNGCEDYEVVLQQYTAINYLLTNWTEEVI